MRNVLVAHVFFLITSNVLHSQVSFLDESFGDQGVVTLDMLPSHGAYYVSLDDKGRYYVGYQEYLDTVALDQVDYKFFRIDEQGNFDASLNDPTDLGVEMAITDQFNPIQRMIFERDEYIYAYEGILDNTSPKLEIFNTEKEKIITLELEKDPLTLPWATRAIKHSNGLFYVYQGYEIWRFLESGKVDESFGNNGVVDINDLQENVDQAVAPLIQKTGSSWIYLSRVQTTQIATEDYIHSVCRLNLDGELDLSFGENGYVEMPGSIGIADIFSESDDAVNFLVITYNAPIYNYSLLKTTQTGEIVTSFGDNGILIDSTSFEPEFDGFLAYSVPFHTFPDQSILFWTLEYFHSDDSINIDAKYAINHYFEDGTRNLSFGDNGTLSLDFIPNSFINNVDVDEQKNIYLFGLDYRDTIFTYSNHQLYKLNGEKLFGPRITSLNAHNFEVVPNPVTDKVVVKYNGPGVEDLVFQLYDASGKLLYRKSNISLSEGEINVLTDFRLGYLIPGTYMLGVTSKLSGISEVLKVLYLD